VLAVWAIVGLVGGWLLHPLAERLGGTAPVVSWLQPLALLLVAGILGFTAYSTRRIVRQRPDLLPPHQAVNRLVLARACAFVGSLVLGGYLGYALSWVGDDAELADERIWRSGAASLAGLLIVITAVLLERACRVGSDDANA
jgi:hypothetical protein